MDIHNTESTNLLLANNEIKFYLTYKDFMDNYPKHLKKWLELQSPYGEEKDFKEEYIQIYAPFFEDYGINGLDFEGFSGKYYGYDVMSGSYNYYNRFFNISLYHDFLKDETDVLRINDNNPAQVLTSEYQKFRDVEYEKVKGEFYYFSYEVRRVLNTFFVWNKETQTIIFDKLKYRNFTKNIKKIVTFLLSDELYTNNNPLSESNSPKKETLPLPVSEPKPQQAEPTQEPQPVPNFGEAQPVPVVSEEPQSEELQEAKNVLINGRKPNLLERYQIADRIFNIDKIITRLNVRAEDKYKILAVLLDCNEHNAKKLINRKYPAKTDQKAIKDFINKYLPE
ncbi:hypothetical protein CAPN004_17680 [Capnocytophaga cynodegmi]|uniref:SPOR domain-containing protein n=1 Tax=Capnocytophaga cynodegmi TaxID=28189 RepID=UPI001AD4B476|nr:hypothetical protein [Capnocytophaga cynodegmi]GIM52738.1 hypothetical protein CAPN004_17680 [Capnocytophaga cynodegmi]